MPPTLHESLPTDPYALRMWHPIIHGPDMWPAFGRSACDGGGGGGERMSVSQLWVRARFYPSHPIACRIERIRIPLLLSLVLSLSNATLLSLSLKRYDPYPLSQAPPNTFPLDVEISALEP